MFCNICIKYFLPFLRSQIEGGAGQLHLTKADVQSIQIPIFDNHSMKNIIELLKSIDTNIVAYEKKKSKTMFLNKGLSNDLLAGSKQVDV